MKHYMIQQQGLNTVQKVEISKDAYYKCRKIFQLHKKTLIRRDGKLYKIYGEQSSYFYETEHNIIVSFVANDIVEI